MGRRRRRKRGGRRSILSKIKILTVLGGSSGALTAWKNASGDLVHFWNDLIAYYTGYDPMSKCFSAENLKVGLVPLAIGAGGSYVASKAGINRYIPFLNL